ncbi:TonB-dependent receptor (plasmid) [Pedobacter sp. BS3]|uniref:TonB-dependent receptor n=1 Tax=Pedobacter sp. BS3 TaxID=2567937 RepID=UPI0011EF876E|nr:TonB-dependent receptor [Pedobacter sp. BS3]TZF86172.1 TonB-dependent receptor [Pedobacter sp. BS3]
MKRSLHFVYSLLMLLFTAIGVYAQTGTISGTISTSDGQPAEAVSVGLKGKGLGTITDTRGYYELKKVKPGTYTLRVSAVGLAVQEKTITLSANQSQTINFTLTENAEQLKEVTVSAVRNKYKVDKPSPSLRLNEPILEMPQNVQVVTNGLIKDQQIFDMLEGVTRNVSGASRTEHWDNYARVTMRGANIQAFRNGMNVTMPWGPLTEDMSFVERIEFVKGPAGFMLGNGEPAGFYNVVTKKPTGETKGEATLSLGSFDTYRSTVDLDGKLSSNGKLLYRLNVMGMLKGSHRQYDYNNRYTLAPVITYKINDKTSITGEYTYQFSQVPLLGSAYVFGANGYATTDRDLSLLEPNIDPTKINDHSAFLTFNHQLNENWKFTAQLAYLTFSQKGSSTWASSIYDDNGNIAVSGAAINGDIRRSINVWDAWGQNKLGQVFLNGNVGTGAVSHKILAGLDMSNKQYLGDWSQSFLLRNADGSLFNIYNPAYGQVPPDSILTYDRSKSLRQRAGASMNYENYTGLYLQDELGFLENRIRLTLAGRYSTLKQFDGYSPETNDSKLTPRVGLSVSIDKQTSFYGLYDQTFLPQSGRVYGGGKIKPLTGNSIEFGLKKDWFGGNWNTTLSVYQITKNNIMGTDTNPEHITDEEPVGTYAIQIGQVKAKGIEFDLHGEIATGLSLIFNYAYTDSKITENGGDAYIGASIDSYAKHNTNGWLSYRVTQSEFKGLGISLGYQYQIDRVAGNWGGINPLNVSLPDYFRLDGAISWQNDNMNIGLNVNNILNKYLYMGAPYEDYYYWQTEPGTNFRLSIGYKF